jgi:hypothetical protein
MAHILLIKMSRLVLKLEEIMRRLMQLGVLAALMIFGMVCIAGADTIAITPEGPGLVMSGNQTSTSDIRVIIAGLLGISPVPNGEFALYKENSNLTEDGILADSYNTAFNSDLSGGSITYVGGAYIANPIYLLIKDGNQTPAWYLFSIQGWNGTDTISLSAFWPARGQISHVAIYGNGVSVPEPNSLLLIGSGILAFGFAGRRWFKS